MLRKWDSYSEGKAQQCPGSREWGKQPPTPHLSRLACTSIRKTNTRPFTQGEGSGERRGNGASGCGLARSFPLPKFLLDFGWTDSFLGRTVPCHHGTFSTGPQPEYLPAHRSGSPVLLKPPPSRKPVSRSEQNPPCPHVPP